MTAQDEAEDLIKHGILVRESMRSLTTEYGNVEEDIINAVETAVERGSPTTALDAINFAAQVAVKVDSEYVKSRVEELSNEFEKNHKKCEICGSVVHVDDAAEHMEKHDNV